SILAQRMLNFRVNRNNADYDLQNTAFEARKTALINVALANAIAEEINNIRGDLKKRVKSGIEKHKRNTNQN
ncbi:MAG: hypothetical protein V1918_04895, partial [Planctomycetota bacterium]